ncbi:hypothetical protein [Methylorubrum thiocyanatum]|uniref:hypothetical protein n=1 Tax=Methylorubrum thiocyanatum TaxID=47958 RepID=UPI0035C7D735
MPAQTVSELAALCRAAGPSRVPEREFRHGRTPEERRHGVGGNGAPALDEPEKRPLRLGAAEALELGEAMYGPRWKAEAAGDTGEDAREIRRWAAGESAPSRASLQRLLAAARRKREREDAAIAALEAFLDAPPPAPPPAPEPEVIIAPGVDPADAQWFLDHLARALTPGRPTFVREVLSARRPPRARHWTAEVRVFDGAVHTLDCDRGADLEGTTVGLAWLPGDGLTTRQPCLLWDDEAGWVRGRDYVRGPKPRLAPVAAPAEPDHVDIEEMIAALNGRNG